MDNSNYVKDKEKEDNELQRYRAIIIYFERNKDRINANSEKLTSLDKTLYNQVKDGPFPRNKSTELYNRLHPLLENNLRKKSGTGTGMGVSI